MAVSKKPRRNNLVVLRPPGTRTAEEQPGALISRYLTLADSALKHAGTQTEDLREPVSRRKTA